MNNKNESLLKVTLVIIVMDLAVGAIFLGKFLSDVYIKNKTNNNEIVENI